MRDGIGSLSITRIRDEVVAALSVLTDERYFGGYGPATASSSFSVAKSFTSALLGQALASGAVRSLDDSVTRYVPELAKNEAYHGVTLRHLLGMRSGIAYTRTNGGMLSTVRSLIGRVVFAISRRSSATRSSSVASSNGPRFQMRAIHAMASV